MANPELTSLQLDFCDRITDNALQMLSVHCLGLTELSLRFCDLVPPAPPPPPSAGPGDPAPSLTRNPRFVQLLRTGYSGISSGSMLTFRGKIERVSRLSFSLTLQLNEQRLVERPVLAAWEWHFDRQAARYSQFMQVIH